MVEQEVAKRLIVLAVLLAPLGAAVQPAGKVYRVGVLSPQNSTDLKAAKALGLTIPQSLLLRADQVVQ